ncbi:zinc finger BED domain-containing protein 5/7/8/9 [Enteropsectra breve]|nr:zinc finger BED domain-containing protein 5/7/8/9 [Enteropsectra breve]
MIHREALASKMMGVELNEVLNIVVEVINYIKSRPLKSRHFLSLCQEMESEHEVLLFCSSSRWLSRGTVLKRVYELKQELQIFLSIERHDSASEFGNPFFLAKLAYLTDIFESFNVLNLQLQRKNAIFFDLSEKIESFTKKVLLWCSQLEKFTTEIFFNLHQSFEISLMNEDQKKIVLNAVKKHLKCIHANFTKYFYRKEDIDLNEWAWVTNPFVETSTKLSVVEQEKLIDISCSQFLKFSFKSFPITQFWGELNYN